MRTSIIRRSSSRGRNQPRRERPISTRAIGDALDLELVVADRDAFARRRQVAERLP